MSDSVKYLLDETRIPKHWYNLVADLPSPPPPVLHPGTLKPVGPDDLAPLFPMSLIMQEVSTEREIEIPEPVRDVYRQWRPTPLFRARRLEKALETPARIYYKYEGVSPAGSHKPNTAVAQAFYNKEAGVRKIATETGAGQWGSALAFAGALFGIDVQVFMVRVSYNQKPYRRAFMETFGARCIASPSTGDQLRPRGAGAQRPTATAASASRSPKPSKWRRRATTPSTRSARCSTTSCCTRRSSARRPSRSWRWPMTIPTSSSAARAAARTSPASRSRSSARNCAAGTKVRVIAVEPAACPSLTRGSLRLRLRRHRPDDAARQDAHARARPSCRRDSTPAACAITAWRRSCRI